MAETVLVNLATGMEDAERVTIAFLVATAAQGKDKRAAIWLTKDAVRLALPGGATGEACDGCPPLERLLEQFTEAGGELLVCPICFKSRALDEGSLLPNAKITGATPLFDWIGDESPLIFSY